MPLRSQFEVLEKLYDFEKRIHRLEASLDHVPESIQALVREMELLDKAHADLKSDHRQHLDARNEKRREFDLETIRLRNTRKKEAQITNQREMEAFVKEVSMVEQTIRELETQIAQLEKLERAAAERLKEHETKLERVRADVEQSRKRHNDANSSGEAELENLYDQRDELLEQLPPSLRDRYNRLTDRMRDGLATARTTGGVCSACHMAVPPQMYNELLSGSRMHQCNSCHRILLPDHRALEAQDDKPEKPEKPPKAAKPAKASKAAARK